MPACRRKGQGSGHRPEKEEGKGRDACRPPALPGKIPGHILGLIVKDAVVKGVDYMGVPVFVIALVLAAVGHVDMAVQEEFGPVFFHEPEKNLEALVGQIPAVIELIGGGVGHQDIEALVPEKLEAQPADPA